MKIIWTNNAELKYYENINYLLKFWNIEVTSNFMSEVNNTIDNLKRSPNLGAFDNLINSNKILITKQIYLFYEITNNEVVLLDFWNNKKKTYW